MEKSYSPFDTETTFTHPLNIQVNQPGNYVFPSVSVRSLHFLGNKTTELTWTNKGHFMFDDKIETLVPGEWKITPLNLIVDCETGDNPQEFLSRFEEAFNIAVRPIDCQELIKETVFDIFASATVVGGPKENLGTLDCLIEEDPFSAAILHAEDNLYYTGDVPEKWGWNAPTKVLNKLSQLFEIYIDGNVGPNAFSHLYFDFDYEVFEVTGTIAANGFDCTDGSIAGARFNKLDADSFTCSHLAIDRLIVQDVDPEANISADIITMPNSDCLTGVIAARKVIITEQLNSPLIVKQPNLTVIDFSTVPAGSYSIKFKNQVQIFEAPSVAYTPSQGTIHVIKGKSAYLYIKKQIRKKFPEIDWKQVELSFNNLPFTKRISSDGQVQAYYNSSLIGQWYIAIDSSNESLMNGFIVGSFVGLSASLLILLVA